MSSSSASRNSGVRSIGVVLVLGISLAIIGILTAWNNDSSIASSPVANPGDILIAGGDLGAFAFAVAEQALFVSSTKSAQLFQTSTGTFVTTSSMAGDREGATGTALPDGTILIAGGLHCVNSSSSISCNSLNTAELYDPISGTFSPAGSGTMTSNRFGQSATPISCGGCPLDGDVLLAGGDSGHFSITLQGGIDNSKEKAVNTAEVYDYRTKTFTAIPNPMKSPREAHVAVVIPNSGGKIVLIGGDDKGFFIESVKTAEIFNPSDSSFTLTAGNMSSAREIAPAIALDPAVVNTTLAGQILVCGGLDAVNSGSLNGSSLGTCELLDPSNGGNFTLVPGNMSSPRTGESLTLFPNGKLSGQVLIAGGVNASGAGAGTAGLSQTSTATSDLFNPTGPSGVLSPTGNLNEPRGGHAVALLTAGVNAGGVLVAGGERCVPGSGSPTNCYVVSSASDKSNGGTADAGEIFDPDTATWTAVTAPMQPPVNAVAGFGVPIPGPAGAGTPTPTSSASSSATASRTPSESPTASATGTAASTSTASSVATATGTSKPTGTPTGMPTKTPTMVPTMTATAVATSSSTMVSTPTPAPVAAGLVVRPGRLGFNQRSTQGKVTVSNPHTRKQDSPIQITGTSIKGDFSVSTTSTCRSSVAPGMNCEYDIIFKPTKGGTSMGTFTITDNSSIRSSSTVTLVGTVKVAPVTIKPTKLNFGKQPLHSLSTPQTVTVTNGNPIAVDLTVSPSGADASDFQITNACPASLNAGQPCMVNVTFAPTATGNRKAILVTSDSGKNQHVALIGIGTVGGPTSTATATMRATVTSTPTATATMQATATTTPIATATAQTTATITPTATSTTTPVPSPTTTVTASATPTMTPITILPSGTPTATATPTSAPTETPIATPTPTAFAIPTPTLPIATPTLPIATPTLPFTIPTPTL